MVIFHSKLLVYQRVTVVYISIERELERGPCLQETMNCTGVCEDEAREIPATGGTVIAAACGGMPGMPGKAAYTVYIHHIYIHIHI